MKKEKRPQHDTVPEIYMGDRNALAFFQQNYPVDTDTWATDVVLGPDDNGTTGPAENTRIEHNL